MMKADTSQKKLHRVSVERCLYKASALLLVMIFGFFQIGYVKVQAAAASTTYPDAHGDENTSTDLYLWHLATKGDRTSLNSYLANQSTSEPIRVLLGFKHSGTYYYVEVNWTKIKYLGESDDVCGTCLKCVPTTENPQVNLGATTFVTRGALRSFFAKNKGKWTAGDSDYQDDYQYEFYAPNETDDAIDVVNGGTNVLYFTRGKSYIDWWIFDGKGIPCGCAEQASTWNEYSNSWAYYKKIDKGNRSWFAMSNWSEHWYDGDDYGENGVISYMFTCENSWGADPQMVHTQYSGSDSDSDYKRFGDNQFTIAEIYSTSDHYGPLGFIVYVGEKVGETTVFDSTNSAIKSNYHIDNPVFLKKDQTLTVEEGCVLYINSILILDGSIDNQGIIIVEDGGAIMGHNLPNSTETWSGTTKMSYLANNGGDLIVRSEGLVSIDNMTADSGSTIVVDGTTLIRKHLELGECVINTGNYTSLDAWINASFPKYSVGLNGAGGTRSQSAVSGILSLEYDGVIYYPDRLKTISGSDSTGLKTNQNGGATQFLQK